MHAWFSQESIEHCRGMELTGPSVFLILTKDGKRKKATSFTKDKNGNDYKWDDKQYIGEVKEHLGSE